MPVIELTELAHGGDAVGHLEIGGERRAVFVRGGAVGDHVELEIDLSTRPARGSILKLAEPGSDRVEPPCPYAARCGGCDWMHVSHAGQLRAHEAHVREAVGDVPIEVHPAERTLRYRERARLHARAAKGRAIVGPNEARSRSPLSIDACAVLHPLLDEARRNVELLLEGANGAAEVGLSLGAERRPVLELRFSADLPPAFFARLEDQTRAGAWAGARVWTHGARVPAVIGDPTPWTIGADGEPLRLAPGGFGQAHAEVNRALGNWAASHAGDARLLGKTTVELYAGAGNLTVLFARRLPRVTAVESDADSCAAAQDNLARRGLRARVVCADAEAFSLPGDTVTVVLDPPRTGAKIVCQSLATSSVRRIVYVSCDPPSLKRDLAFLADRFAIRNAALFEMFPHTSHVECAVVLTRRKK